MNIDLVSSIWLIIKVFIIIGMVLYAGFAAIMLRQIQLMSNVLEEAFESILKLLAFVHLVAVIAVIFLAVKIL
jgi:hypothetical protein